MIRMCATSSLRRVSLGTLLLIMTVGLASCGGNAGGGGAPPPESTSPTIAATAPGAGATNVTTNANVAIEFSEAMDRSATESAFAISPATTCAFGWNAESTILTCQPAEDLAHATTYTVSVGGAAKSVDGSPLASPFSLTFTTARAPDDPDLQAPTVTRTVPANLSANVSTLTNIVIEFSQAMDTASVSASLVADPAIACVGAWNADATRFTCTLTAPLLERTIYIISVLGSARAVNGQTLGEPFFLGFSTEGSDPMTYYVYGGPAPYETYLGCLGCNDYSTESIFNEFGQFGRFRTPSMMNDFDQYGSAYSTYSACNSYALDPPRVFDKAGNYYGKLTINEYALNRFTNTYYLDRLEAEVCSD